MSSIFDIIDTHESEKVREMALDHLRRFLPRFKREQVLDLWITHPLPSIRPVIEEIIKEHGTKIRTPTLVATHIMLGNYEKVDELDPDFAHIDSYLNSLDPLLGSLLVSRVVYLKSRKFKSTHKITEDSNKLSVIDLIGRRDWDALWESVFSYPFPFICELLKIFRDNNYVPRDKESREFHQLLEELIGVEGWEHVEEVLYQAVSVLDTKSQHSRKLTPAELRGRTFSFEVSSELFNRPDRIKNAEFTFRGRRNLMDDDLGIYIYEEYIRHSNFTESIHVPMYAANGSFLLEFIIPAHSEHDLSIDEDGTFFSVRSRGKIYSVDIDVLSIFVNPIDTFQEIALDNVQLLKSEAPQHLISIFEGLELLIDMHLGRSFKLKDLKERRELAVAEPAKCCALGIDFGNKFIRLSVLPSKCDHPVVFEEQPSIIHYIDAMTYLCGNEVLEQSLEDSYLTYRDIKRHMLSSSTKVLRVQSKEVDAATAAYDFLTSIIQLFLEKVGYKPNRVAFSYPEFAYSSYRNWMISILDKLGFEEIYGFEDTTAVLAYSYRLYKSKDAHFHLDIGDMHTTFTVAEIPTAVSKKRKLSSLLAESHMPPLKLVTKRFIDEGADIINKVIEQMAIIRGLKLEIGELHKLSEKTKFQLTEKFEATINDPETDREIVFTLGEEEETGIDTLLQMTDYFAKFKIALSETVDISEDRGVGKRRVKHLSISGGGNRWPLFAKYLLDEYDKKLDVIYEDEPQATSHGLAILANSQELAGRANFDIILRVNEKGESRFYTLVARGEPLTGHGRVYLIERKATFSNLVLDLWLRRTHLNTESRRIIRDSDMKVQDNLYTEGFQYDRIFAFPLVVDISDMDEPALLVGIDRNGWLVVQAFDYSKKDNGKPIRVTPLL